MIQDGDFALTESVAIMKYLASTRDIADHWYPKDSKSRARVDEYLAWQHQGITLRFFKEFYHCCGGTVIMPLNSTNQNCLHYLRHGRD